MKSLLPLLVLLSLSFSMTAQVVISEIMYNPPEAGTDSLEYVELYNNSMDPINLEGWSFTQGFELIFEAVTLESNAYLIVCVNKTAFETVFGSSDDVIQWQSGALQNGGELIELSDNEGNSIFSVNYNSGANGWYTEADGNGASLEFCNLDGNPDLNTSWLPSTNSTGIVLNDREILATPGEANSTTCDGAVVIFVNDFEFTPRDITVSVGQLVRWENQSGHHNVNGSQATFPTNPESFSSGSPQTGNWSYEFIFTEEGLYNYRCDPHAGQGMTGTVFVGEADLYLNVTIPELRVNNQNGLPLLIGSKVRTRGVVHTPNFRPSSLEFFIINNDNIGVSVFRGSGNLGYTVSEGDEIEIEGTLGEFRGLTQIIAEGITVNSTGNELVEPRLVTTLNESTEGSLVQFLGDLQDAEEWTNEGTGFNVTFEDSDGNDISVRILSATEIFGTDPLAYGSVIGVGSQFTSDPPFNTGYQLLPRYLSDFEERSSVRIVSTLDLEIFPNPAEDQIQIISDVSDFEFSIFNQSGIEVMKGNTITNKSLDVSALATGMYYLIVRKNKEFGVQKLIIL